jgi:hypothetical protein
LSTFLPVSIPVVLKIVQVVQKTVLIIKIMLIFMA